MTLPKPDTQMEEELQEPMPTNFDDIKFSGKDLATTSRRLTIVLSGFSNYFAAKKTYDHIKAFKGKGLTAPTSRQVALHNGDKNASGFHIHVGIALPNSVPVRRILQEFIAGVPFMPRKIWCDTMRATLEQHAKYLEGKHKLGNI